MLARRFTPSFATNRGFRSRKVFLGALGLAALGVAACVPAGDGVSPPSERIYFPVGVAVDGSSDWLYVVNSDFDLQFNQGTVQSVRLDRVREVVPRTCDPVTKPCPGSQTCDDGQATSSEDPSFFCVDDGAAPAPCGAGKEATPSQRALAPGRCAPFSPQKPPDGGPSLIEQTAEISAFATDVVFASRPADAPEGPPGRLFIPVRGDSTLHWLDVDAGQLECGQSGGGTCDGRHRLSDNENANGGRGVDMPTEPFGISATADGRIIAVTHQTTGRVSSFLNDWRRDPRLVFVEKGLPSRPIGVATVPFDASTSNHQASFLVAFRNDPSVHLLNFFDDGALEADPEDEPRPGLVDVGRALITTNSLGFDSRGIAVDDSTRAAAQSACAAGDAACAEQAASVPLDVYVTNRTPPSLVIGRIATAATPSGTTNLPVFYDNVPLTAGPSRAIVGHVTDENGLRKRRIFVLCFDSSLIFVYDPERRSIETEIFTGRGPYSMAFDDKDPERPMAYVGHFTDSFIGVVSLDRRSPRTYGTFITTIGAPSPPRASK